MPRRFILGALVLVSCAVSAQQWPSKPIHVVVPNTAGSVGEVLLRAIAPQVEARLGQRLLVDNKPGAAGNIGTAEVARAAPDGYTLLLAPTANYAVNQHLFPNLGFDPLAALEPVAMLAEAPLLAVINAEVPARSLKELEQYVRANPGKLNYGAPGTGSPSHLTGALFSQLTGNAMVYVPYKGIAPMVQALLANDIQVTFPTITTVLGALKTGRVRVLAVMGRERLPELPEVPTTVEAGFPDLVFGNWWVLSAPHGTDARSVERLAREVDSALADPAVRKRIRDAGHLPSGLSRAATAAFLRSESARYKKIVETGRIKPEL